MAPPLEYGKRYDQGLNVLNSSLVSQATRRYYEDHMQFESGEITPEMLQGMPPGMVNMIRNIGRAQLLSGLEVGNPEAGGYRNITVEKIFDTYKPEELISVGETYREPADTGKSLNMVVPVMTDKGSIEIVVNDASGGIGWRLGPGHPALNTYPMLSRVINEDRMLGEGRWVLRPEVLAEFTNSQIDISNLSESIKLVIEMLVHSKNLKLGLTGHSAGATWYPDGYYTSWSLGLSETNFDVINLAMGYEYGWRPVMVSSFYSPDDQSIRFALKSLNKGVNLLNRIPAN